MDKKLRLTSSAQFVQANASEGHPNLGWLEFILTDDKPNENKQGVPRSAFAALVDSGLFMPLKIGEGEISKDHDNAKPLGTIAKLTPEEDKILGKAAIWKADKPDEYKMLVEKHSSDEPINISWEILYSKSTIDDDGVEWLSDPVLVGAAIVSKPAYGDRTPVLSVASTVDDENTAQEEVTTEDSSGETESPAEKELAKLKETLATLEEEVATLRKYKKEREEADAKASKLAERVEALKAAGFEFSLEEIQEKQDAWAAMDDNTFELMLEAMKKVKSSAASVHVPDVHGDDPSENDIVEIVRQGLKELRRE